MRETALNNSNSGQRLLSVKNCSGDQGKPWRRESGGRLVEGTEEQTALME